MGILDNAKELAKLAQEVGKLDLYQKAIDLQAQLVELSDAKFNLVKEVAELRERLTVRDELEPDHDTYLRVTPGREGNPSTLDGPYCTCCWDSNSKLIRLHVLRNGLGGAIGLKCPSCTTRVEGLKSVERVLKARKS